MTEESRDIGCAARHAAVLALAALCVAGCGDQDEGGATRDGGREAAPEGSTEIGRAHV